MNRDNWRFYTRPMEADDAAGHLWCWAQLDDRGRVINERFGFYTATAAMRDARANGFPGPVDLGDPEEVLREFGDRRAFAICGV